MWWCASFCPIEQSQEWKVANIVTFSLSILPETTVAEILVAFSVRLLGFHLYLAVQLHRYGVCTKMYFLA